MTGRAVGLLMAIAITAADLQAQGAITPARVDDSGWVHEPCLPDSVDSFFWTRYDLRGIRIRIPNGVKHIKNPSLDELHFRLGQATMRLRVHLDASRIFAEVYTPQNTRKHCFGDIGGLMAEAISLGGGSWFGFAARWPDADRGEWLTAVIRGGRLAEVTLLRRTLFTLVFPDERR
jgi:hypothetical protein